MPDAQGRLGTPAKSFPRRVDTTLNISRHGLHNRARGKINGFLADMQGGI